ncbi:hypothetical protein IU436_04805 [Nocardia farcinica]|uniref:hypothetical protein n=1 Tax=Nocardia TaxID=1817 RepID=UPI000BEFDFB6|nr:MULTISPECIES: hypothetical protein [Nocardia]MBF6070735.1 hypothetical protein [Nocardia farcinica]MBF6184064.1 hypothetical protein [Nocardia farcinica]MBF6293008.1 hypothetical protein [Nocardia farcinica]MBF6309907.1 hypothetical protein [Nocardia farcinica]MBF6379303.1 hypothetical protein [Nocardia farcinica]
MICPHCARNLLYKERSGRRCSKCAREFALEPKLSPFRLHDLRIRRLADKLGDGRGLRYTPTQLWYALARKDLPGIRRVYHAWVAVTAVVIVVAAFVSMVSGLVPVLVALPAAVGLLVAVNLVLLLVRPLLVRMTTVQVPVRYSTFRSEVLEPWRRIYRDLPPGMVDEDLALPAVEWPRLALLCPDRGVLACLAANDAHRAWGMALCERVEQLPPAVPVLLLHDAGAPGVEFAARVRAVLGSRVVPIGLSTRAARTARSAVRLRERPLRSAVLPPELPADDREWLLDGWWSPVAALPPARLLGLVQRGVERVEEAADPDRRSARAVGFLTWPTS